MTNDFGFRLLDSETMKTARALKDDAWVGDAVLALYVRRWILEHGPKNLSDANRQELFELFVSNQFLSSFGAPTQLEAAIGRTYAKEGLAAAFAQIENSLLAAFLKRARKRGYTLRAQARCMTNNK
jgi:23S rRNA maturation mini-RNase III